MILYYDKGHFANSTVVPNMLIYPINLSGLVLTHESSHQDKHVKTNKSFIAETESQLPTFVFLKNMVIMESRSKKINKQLANL